MRRKTILHALNTPAASPLISPTRKRADNSHSRGRATFASKIVPNRPAKVWWEEGARLGSDHYVRLPKRSTGAPAGSLTDHTLAPLPLPSSPSGHS
jgi:hypothetical protein